MRSKSLAIIIFLGVFFPFGIVWSRTAEMKQACANCHTMHNSQNGAPGTPGKEALLTNTCYGCHSDGQAFTDKPVVWHIVTANYGTNTLAGGDFNWAVSNPLKGHDVDGIVTQTTRTAPGGTRSFDLTTRLSCAGINGCHGNFTDTSDILAMYQTHHAPETAQPMDGTSLQRSYRLLHSVDGYIAGFEDPKYEFPLTLSATDHNQYKGVARSADTDSGTSISYSCAACHGDFHSGAGDAGIDDASSFASPWLRHPVDYAMGLTGEYAAYGGAGVNAYNVATPLGSNDVTTQKSVVTGVGDAIIVCVSCHRAHGSPYDYSLRWNYLGWPAAAGSNGCGDCHTAKN